LLRITFEPGAELPDLAFRLVPERGFSSEETRQLTRLLLAWYELGVYGAYGGVFHNMSDVTQDERGSIVWSADLGSAGEYAFNVLDTVLQEFSRVHSAPLDRLIVS
jgi:hypothetical protein